MTPTVIDTDPGIDDALALLLAWGSPELDVLALTVVAGNADIARGTSAQALAYLNGGFGSYTFKLTVTDAKGNVSTQNFTINYY